MPVSTPSALTHPMLVICGPTATGKTQLAISLAQQFYGQIISADSRQLYLYMDIGTGKDLPANVIRRHQTINRHTYPYYQIKGVKLWGYDLFTPDQPISIAQYQRYIRPLLTHSWRHSRLPIVTGGSGLYLDSLLQPPETINIPPDISLRQKLSRLSVTQLQAQLSHVAPHRYNKMNFSDQQNPRRLVRAIETSLHSSTTKPSMTLPAQVFTIGLTCPIPILKQRIHDRVLNRANGHFDQEIDRLLDTYPQLAPNAASTIGYAEWLAYRSGQINRDTAIVKWQQREYQYAKRQLTWFISKTNIHWFDISLDNWQSQVERLVKNWYATTSL